MRFHTFKTFEIRYEDRLPKGYHSFRKDWNKHKNEYGYYVQFTNFKGDKLDKSSYVSPDHSDPKGNYGYPLKYVVDYPMDIWYGINAKFLRVLEINVSESKILYLNEIKSKDKCISLLSLIFTYRISELETLVKKIRTQFKSRISGGNTWGKTFFQAVQVKFNDDKWEIRSAEEQTELFLRGGWKILIDESKNINSAIINDREPEQAVFLTPDSFKVKSIYKLIDKEEINNSTVAKEHEVVIGRKWASKILEIFDDKIKETGEKFFTSISYYTVKGRRISLKFEKPSNDDVGFGQKPYKVHKKYDNYDVYINIQTEKGNIDIVGDKDESFEDILLFIKQEWNDIKDKPNVENWEPRSLERTKRIKKEKEDEAREKAYKKKEEEALKELPRFVERLKYWNNKFNRNWKEVNQETSLKYLKYSKSLFFRYPFNAKGLEQDKGDISDIINNDELRKGFFNNDSVENINEYIQIMIDAAKEIENNKTHFEYGFYND